MATKVSLILEAGFVRKILLPVYTRVVGLQGHSLQEIQIKLHLMHI